MVEQFSLEEDINKVPLLSYVVDMAYSYLPDVDYDGLFSSSSAAEVFRMKINDKRIEKHFEYDDYLKNKYIQEVVEGFGFDRDKFWFALLFIYDYTYCSCEDGYENLKTPKDQIDVFVDTYKKYISTLGSADDFVGKITISMGKEKKVVIDNPMAVGFLCTTLDNICKKINPHSELASPIRHSYFNPSQADEAIFIYVFARTMLTFLSNKKIRRKKDSTTSLSKLVFVSNLIHFTGILKDKRLLESEEYLKNNIKYYKKENPETPRNSCYNEWYSWK